MKKLSKNWLKMAEIYKRFSDECLNFSEEAAMDMFLHESTGSDISLKNNGFAAGKKWMDVTIKMWKEDIKDNLLIPEELLDSGYPDWFLKRIGIINVG
ncbi:MAG: hypothetical protein EPN88_13785 [Bacteroidetes bacterium]|nr:MAG: hypothetical protein EPN88_13785 [Bacteroidota bacterium]